MMFDAYTNRMHRILANLLINCPRCTILIKSMDASAHVKDPTLISKFMDVFLQEIDLHNVVKIITNNAVNYVISIRMLMETQRSFFWTPCTAHHIDLSFDARGYGEKFLHQGGHW